MTGAIGTILQHIGSLFRWWVQIMPWEQGVRVWLGKHVRLIGPGMHLRIPFLHRIYKQTTRVRVVALAPQTVTSKDGETITVTLAIGYTIDDVLRLYQSVHDPEKTLCNMALAEVARVVSAWRAEGCDPADLAKAVADSLDLERFGLGSKYVRVVGWARVRTYRLIQDSCWQQNDLNLDLHEGQQRQ